ncbi:MULTISPECIES: aspartate kinase [Vagococcus]|uniref:Aspartokinase n=1 Tax=Vagococcus fluvialis bH819 TaxID=1255619 RepID=A0A1X6WM17_9ENTE|nr:MULTISPECIES: aspartate kinase [Vagococcus]SLM85298.1 Aspartokinase [Vagococcus fluvialis bH819]HCM89406.1 aspartate kinase [Vagococcus sp.]
MKVAKFGGSSLADATQINKILNIIKADSERRFIIVSAPGKRYETDTKVTDLLIQYAENFLNNQNTALIEEAIIYRYQLISQELQLNKALPIIKKYIETLKKTPHRSKERVMDLFKSSGENCHAMLIAEFLTHNGIPSTYINPKDAGILVDDLPGEAIIKPEAYLKIKELKKLETVAVIPGFFGYTKEGEICTFSRGGSDVTGSIIAAGVQADCYENFTDVDAIYAANPGLIANCQPIKELTFREMRELSYTGFRVLHDESLMPARQANIPVIIKNTNNPEAPGTRISSQRTTHHEPVAGIAGDSGFTSIYLSKYLMNRQLGFGYNVLKIFKELNLQFDHMPSGIDDITIIMRQNQLTQEIEEQLISRLTTELSLDELKVMHNISMIALVGEGMKNNIGVASRATAALSKKKINLEMINQGSSEVSILFAINNDQENAAIKALYEEFF